MNSKSDVEIVEVKDNEFEQLKGELSQNAKDNSE